MAYLTGRNKNHTYLKRFFAETTKVDHDLHFSFVEGDTAHVMPYSVVVEGILGAPASEQVQIAATIRKIDFHNGDISHFLRFLGQQMARTLVA